MTDLTDLVGTAPAAEAPVPVAVVDIPDPVGAVVESLADVPALSDAVMVGVDFSQGESVTVEQPVAPPNLEAAQAAAEAAVVMDTPAPEVTKQELFPSSEGAPIVERAPPVTKPRVDHRPPDADGFRYEWQRSRARGRRF